MLFIPELILQSYIATFVSEIKASIVSDPLDNLITKMFVDVPILQSGKLNYKDEAQKFFTSINEMKIRVGFNLGSFEDMPILMLTLPSENFSTQTIGQQSDEHLLDTSVTPDTNRELKEYSSDVQYSLMIVSKNGDQVVWLHHILKWMFIRYQSKIELDGFQNLKISANDMMMESQLAPPTLFIRAVNLAFRYTIQVMDAVELQLGNAIVPDSTAIDIKTQ